MRVGHLKTDFVLALLSSLHSYLSETPKIQLVFFLVGEQ